MSWIVSLQGALVGHTDFVYSFLGLLRCTLKFGMHNQIHEQDLPPNPLDAISYSFETRYVTKPTNLALIRNCRGSSHGYGPYIHITNGLVGARY